MKYTMSTPGLVVNGKPRLIAVFIGVVGIGIMAVGYLFNALSLQ